MYLESDTLIDNVAAYLDLPEGLGGAIENSGRYSMINNCMISGNRATEYGSAIYNSAHNVSLMNSTITNNKIVSDNIGSIYNYLNASLTIINSIVTGNHHITTGVENNINLDHGIVRMVYSVYGVDEDINGIAKDIHNVKASASSVFTGSGIEISPIGEAADAGTLVGHLRYNCYYRDMDDNKWKSFTITNAPDFDVDNTVDYGLGAGAEIFTTSLNGVSRVWTHDYYNAGAYAIPPLSFFTVDAIPDQIYTGAIITPDVVVKDGVVVLTKDVDYEVSYTNNIDVGVANVTITGKGKYHETLNTTFRIVAKPITSIDFIPDQIHTGSAITPTVVVKSDEIILTEGVDYEVEYIDNVAVGTAHVTVIGKGNYTGVLQTTFQIIKVYNVDIHNIIVTGAQYDIDSKIYVVDCGRKDIEVTVVTVGNTARVIYNGMEGNPFTVGLERPGFYTVNFTVVSQDGLVSKEYPLTLEKRFEFDEVVVTRWNNTLTVINNPANNGGYTFTSFKWFRNGHEIATGQSISAGSAGEWLNANDLYYVVLTANEYSGSLRSCEGNPNMRSSGVKVWPNPALQSDVVNVEVDMDVSLFPGAIIEVYNVLGACIHQAKVTDRVTQIKLSAVPGVYVITLKGLDDGDRNIKVVVK